MVQQERKDRTYICIVMLYNTKPLCNKCTEQVVVCYIDTKSLMTKRFKSLENDLAVIHFCFEGEVQTSLNLL